MKPCGLTCEVDHASNHLKRKFNKKGGNIYFLKVKLPSRAHVASQLHSQCIGYLRQLGCMARVVLPVLGSGASAKQWGQWRPLMEIRPPLLRLPQRLCLIRALECYSSQFLIVITVYVRKAGIQIPNHNLGIMSKINEP